MDRMDEDWFYYPAKISASSSSGTTLSHVMATGKNQRLVIKERE
jgi:hypothetical protein